MANGVWKPIEDLPANWPGLRAPDLESLADIWKNQANKLQDSAALKQFNERLGREWAIETGIIENIYSIDRGTTQLLIEKGIETALIPYGTTDQPAEVIVPILRAQQEALEGLFRFVKQEQELSNFYIRQLHQVLTRNQPTVIAQDQFGNLMEVPLARGEWKKLPNNPTRPDGLLHQYSPPEQVQAEMDRLIELHAAHDRQGVPPEVEAAWLHHRFTQIHPFQDGNGRVARSLATLVLLRAGWFPLVVTRDDRAAYIETLERADDGDLKPLVELVAHLQKKAIIRALSLSQDVLDKQESLQEVIASIGTKLQAEFSTDDKEYEAAVQLAIYLKGIALKQLDSVVKALNLEFSQASKGYKARLKDEADFSGYVGTTIQVSSVARALNVATNLDFYLSMVGIGLSATDDLSDLIIAFHILGERFTGIMVTSAFVTIPGGQPSLLPSPATPLLVTDEVFEFTYNEDRQALVERFEDWLNRALINALKLWRKQIF